MKIKSYESYKWQCLWVITEVKDGAIFKTRDTGFHVPQNAKIPEGYTTSPISTRFTRFAEVEINPHPEIK